MGAVGEDGVRGINPTVALAAGVSEDDLAAVQVREQAAVEARAARYRARRPREPLARRVAVVVDDGIATGSTARAACQIARALGAARVVLAVPVAPPVAPAGKRRTQWPAPILSRPPHGPINGSRTRIAGCATADDIANAETPSDERRDSIGPQVRHRCRSTRDRLSGPRP